MKWLILGSSPGMQNWADLVFAKADIVTTCNKGIFECLHQHRDPDWYCLMELWAAPVFERYIMAAQKRGTKLVTTDSGVRGLRSIQSKLKVDRELTAAPVASIYRPGLILPNCGSGSTLLQFAIAEGATTIMLCGMEGYRSNDKKKPQIDYFDGSAGPAHGNVWTRTEYGPIISLIVKTCHNIKFIFYGDLQYPINAPNAQIIT